MAGTMILSALFYSPFPFQPKQQGNSKKDPVTEAHNYLFSILLLFIILSAVRLSPLGTAATTGLLYQPRMIDDDGDCGTIGGMQIGW
jgi:hypothetical protein